MSENNRYCVEYVDDPMDVDSYVTYDGEYIDASECVTLLNTLTDEKQNIFDYIMSEIHFNDKKFIETEDECFKYTSIVLSNILRQFGSL